MRVTFTSAPTNAAAEQLVSLAHHLERKTHRQTDLQIEVTRDQEARWLGDPVSLITALLGSFTAATELALRLRDWRIRRVGAGRHTEGVVMEVNGERLTLQQLIERLEAETRDGDGPGDGAAGGGV